MTPEQRLKALGLELPAAKAPAGNYASAVAFGGLLYISGRTVAPVDGQMPQGKLGERYTAAEGRAFAQSACLDLLAVIKASLGSLDAVAQFIELHGALNTTADFADHAAVLDGASDLLADVFGPAGVHARSVVGVHSLRNGVPLTLKATVAIKPHA